jgi:DNA-binding Xre family transcriptional regulator
MMRWLMDSAIIQRGIQKMDLHNYVDKGITSVRLNNIMGYARGKHT